MRLEERLYRDPNAVKKEEGLCRIIQLENESGYATLRCYVVEDGMEVIYNDFHMECWNANQPEISDSVEINYCRSGRFECEFRDKTCLYMGADDLAINILTNKPLKPSFPLKDYQGISFLLDIEKTQKIVDRVLPDAVNVREVFKNLCTDDICRIVRENEAVHHIFSELYQVPMPVHRSYMKMKILELILILSVLKMENISTNRYFNVSQVQKVKQIKRLLTENPQEHYTIEYLAQRFDISPSSLKTCFKGVYGQSLYAFLKEYRMDLAAQLLMKTDMDIMEIASRIGYRNASKFSSAFSKVHGCLPNQYRRENQ